MGSVSTSPGVWIHSSLLGILCPMVWKGERPWLRQVYRLVEVEHCSLPCVFKHLEAKALKRLLITLMSSWGSSKENVRMSNIPQSGLPQPQARRLGLKAQRSLRMRKRQRKKAMSQPLGKDASPLR